MTDGGQAFPMHERDDALRGMSLRDYFAAGSLAQAYSIAYDARGDPNWRYHTAAETAQPGYLRRRFADVRRRQNPEPNVYAIRKQRSS